MFVFLLRDGGGTGKLPYVFAEQEMPDYFSFNASKHFIFHSLLNLDTKLQITEKEPVPRDSVLKPLFQI